MVLSTQPFPSTSGTHTHTHTHTLQPYINGQAKGSVTAFFQGQEMNGGCIAKQNALQLEGIYSVNDKSESECCNRKIFGC